MDEDRKQRLAAFVAWCRDHITGDEKSDAQIFLDRLFQAFAQRGCLDVGGKPEFRVKPSSEDAGGTRFADYVWKPVVLIEMKKRGSDLAKHAAQAFAYWTNLAPGRPRYVVLCNFDEFWVYDPEDSTYEPADKLTLTELPDRYEPLAFLFPTSETPRFRVNRLHVTRSAADRLARCFRKLEARQDVGRERAQRFILQMLVALFSEDIGLLPKQFVTQLLDECTSPPKTFDLLGGLFTAMNTRGGVGGGRFKEVDYFNGGLFERPEPVELSNDELLQLKEAARENWAYVSPDIFGTIFQHSMQDEERHAFGAHYTSQEDILKIVRPTLIDPFTHAIDRADSLKALNAIRHRLQTLRVLDPACGSGNFLYIAYREMRRLEIEILRRENEISKRQVPGQTALGGVSPNQFFGLDVLPFAVELAKVTLSIAPKLASDELHTHEKTLPLVNLDNNILLRDALIVFSEPDRPGPGPGQPTPTPWPPADVIIGNPPFLGAKRLKPERGADYVNAIRRLYPDVPGMADYCVYWVRRAHDHLPDCSPDDPFRGRAGLVGTQNIRNNQSRVGGLDHVVQSGTIVEAVENQPWSGEANVHVSIVNWVKTSDAPEQQPARPQRAGASPPPAPPPPSEPPAALGEDPTVVRAPDAGAGDGPARSDSSNRADPAVLLIPARKKLWHKVEPASPLFDPPAAAASRVATRTPGKRGKTRKDKSYELAFRECDHINSALSDEIDLSGAKVLACNAEPQRVSQGITPGHDGFVLTPQTRKDLIASDAASAKVIYPYLVGREMLSGDGQPERFVIDFGQRDVLECQQFKAVFAHVKSTVLPEVQAKANAEKDGESSRQQHLQRWWMHWRGRADLIASMEALHGRLLVCSRVTKRPAFAFIATAIRPGDALQAFTFDDDYSFGILQSDTHWQWFIAKCSKLKSDFRYTPESVFDTFPWPQGPEFRGPGVKQIGAVAEAGREVRRVRDEALKKIRGGLRAVYRALELPGKNPLKDAHAKLDRAVLDAYGFSPKDDILSQLLELNLAVGRRLEADPPRPVTAPGVPPSYPNPASLNTDDCIRPG